MRCLSESQLFAVVDGQLEPGARASIEAHIDRCSACRRTVAALLDSGAGRPVGADPEALLPGVRLGRYVVEGVLGSGGMGIVYAARDLELQRTVALKLVFAEPGRIRREAQVMARLSHPNIVPVYSIVSCDLGDFLAMERIEGPSVRRWLDGAQRPTRAIVDVFIGAGRGLSAAHRAGIVHRDFKPDNVLITGHGRARITDFGLSCGATESVTVSSDSANHGSMPTGGTPAYAAPEQLAGGPPSPLADQYSFCVSLFEALTGRRPERGHPGGLRWSSAVPASLRRTLRRGLQFDPRRRFPSMDALLESLEGFEPTTLRDWTGPLIATSAVVGVLAWQPTEHSIPCTSSAIDPVWSESRRAALQARVEAADGEHTERIVAEVDRYVVRWRQESEDVCDRHSDEELQRRALAGEQHACLLQRMNALDTLLSVLEDSPGTVEGRGLSAVFELEPPGECIRPRPTSAPTFELSTSDGAARLSDAALRAGMLERIGRPDEGLAILSTAIRDPGSDIPLGLEGRLKYGLGALHKALGHHDEAIDFLGDAFWNASARGDHDTAFVASRDLASVAIRDSDWERAKHWLGQAEAQAERLGAPPRWLADVFVARGNLHLGQRELLEAEGAYERAQQLHTEAGITGLRSLTVAHNLAMVAGQRGGPAEALVLHRANLEDRRTLLGERHPEVARSLVSIAAHESELSEFDSALANLEEALRIYEGASGPEARDVLDTLENIAGVLGMAGRLDESKRRLGQLLVLAERTENALLAGHVSINLGDVALASKDPAEAEHHFRRALRQLESRLEPTDFRIAHAIGGIGEAYLGSERPKAAVDYLERALAIRAEHPQQRIMLARARMNLARALWDSELDRARALDLAVTARDALPRTAGRARLARAYIEAWLDDRAAPPR